MKVSVIAQRAAIYLALGTVAIAQPLLQLYSNNVAVFATANYEGAIVVWFALVVLLTPPLVFTAIDVLALAVLPRWEKYVHRSLVFIGLWATMSVIFRSVSFGPWLADAALTASLAVLLLFAYARIAAIKSWVALMSPLSLVVALAFGFSAKSVIAPPEAEVLDIKKSTSSTVPGPGTPKEDVSVLWIVLDEAPLFSLLKSDGTINEKRFPGFAELAASSTWYRNIVGTSQTTTDAVPAMLTGKYPKSGVGPVLANHPNNLFTLMNGHLSMDAHEVVTALCPRKVCSTVSVSGGEHIANPLGIKDSSSSTNPLTDIVTTDARTPFVNFLKDAAVVVGHKVLPQELRAKLPPIDEAWGGFGNAGANIDDIFDEETEEVDSSSTTTVPLTEETKETNDKLTVTEWLSGGPQTQIPVVENVVQRAAQSDRPTLHFVHSLLPHRPWTLTPDLRADSRQPPENRPPDIIDVRRDRVQSYLSQLIATDSMIAKMMTTLKRSANWNRTMIIVTADHGITFQKGESLRKYINVKSPGTLDDIYRIPLFIKYPDQASGTVSDCPASSVDLLATVSAATGIDAGWVTDGSDLRNSCPTRTSRPIIWPKGSFNMTTSFTQLLERVSYYDKWIDADGDVDDIYRGGLSGSLVGQPVGESTRVSTDIQWTLDDADKYQNAGTGRFTPVASYASGRITALRDFSKTEEALLVMEGVVYGVVSELTGMKKNNTIDFVSIPMSRLQTPGPHTMELWVVDWTDPAQPVFSRVK